MPVSFQRPVKIWYPLKIRPCQINVRSQHSADFGFIWGFGIIHLIPEPFQPLGGGNLIGVVLRAAAGGKRGGAGDRTVEYQYGFSP